MKKTKALLAALLLFASAATGCAESNTEAISSQGNTASLKIGYLPSPGHLLYFVAQEEGLFKRQTADMSFSPFWTKAALLRSQTEK